MSLSLLFAGWPAPEGVVAAVSTRQGGVSEGTFASLNMGLHVKDDPARVIENRGRFQQFLPGMPAMQWVEQVHGTQVLVVESAGVLSPPPVADALYTRQKNIALAVMTADCLPVCFASFDGKEIAIVHAGWRGLVNGVLESTLSHFKLSSRNIMAWLGPAIGPCHFEVGDEVREAFINASSHGYRSETEQAFTAMEKEGHWLADLYALAMIRLVASGITAIHGGGSCTICENRQYYSYRRDAVTGRIATVIYRN